MGVNCQKSEKGNNLKINCQIETVSGEETALGDSMEAGRKKVTFL